MDVVNMRWSNVDLENGLLNFSVRKTGKRALIALHEDFADWLEGRRRPADGQAYLFPSLACEDAVPSGRCPCSLAGLSRGRASAVER
jgi:integrase